VVAGEGCGAVGEGLVVATSGVPGTFQVVCRDVFGNLPDDFDGTVGATLYGALLPPSNQVWGSGCEVGIQVLSSAPPRATRGATSGI